MIENELFAVRVQPDGSVRIEFGAAFGDGDVPRVVAVANAARAALVAADVR